MTRARTLSLLVMAGALIGCEPDGSDTPVVLNERIFDLPFLDPAGKGCSTYHLARSGQEPRGESSSGRGNAPGLVITQRSSGSFVAVEVSENNILVTQRRYDEAFFRAGKLDEFVATATTGERKMLRYWGAVITDGVGQCAPFEDDGPRPR